MAALSVQERRIDVLSRSKPITQGFIEDRRSVYWVDKKPLVSNGTTEFVLSSRLEQLAGAKRIDNYYMGDRPTPIWPVSEQAKQACSTQRLASLAYPRLVHKGYKYERSPYTTVTPGAKRAEPSARLDSLANPKPHKMWSNSKDTLSEGDFSTPIWLVSDSARNAPCSNRVETLAAAKTNHPSYGGERSVQWPVTESAMNSVATLRLQQLARPKSGRLKKDDYDPYRVSAASRNARATPRMTELSLPIPRKVRQKKV